MKQFWQQKSSEEIKRQIFYALGENVSYSQESILGVPGSYLDEKVFTHDAGFLKDAPYLSTLLRNPNHIGVHTLGSSEPFFQGTQAIEKELIDICAVDILAGEPDAYDGYVASGGTEANMQALWMYRNYFQTNLQAKGSEIAIMASADAHYSIDKAANVLGLPLYKVAVEQDSRELTPENVAETVQRAQQDGKKYFIVVATMMTTMFGSVDDPKLFTDVLKAQNIPFKLHVDGAYGGFYFPFTSISHQLNFQNPDVSSVTLDAHKMVQAPYGTGIFICRKGLIENVHTREASYVEGEDYTLIGSRSGANAIAIWMILATYGPFGWEEKIYILQKRAAWLCKQLEEAGIQFYRHPGSNIITIKSEFIPEEVAHKYWLVPDRHHATQWQKIVIMEHVTIEKLMPLVEELKKVERV
ncbi:MAG: aminotransferase class I/II-fold pyridoxal phosphate-dependent enzyme [Bacteroidota bacterium]